MLPKFGQVDPVKKYEPFFRPTPLSLHVHRMNLHSDFVFYHFDFDISFIHTHYLAVLILMFTILFNIIHNIQPHVHLRVKDKVRTWCTSKVKMVFLRFHDSWKAPHTETRMLGIKWGIWSGQKQETQCSMMS